MASSHMRKRLEIGMSLLTTVGVTLWLRQKRTLYLSLRIDSSVGLHMLPANM